MNLVFYEIPHQNNEQQGKFEQVHERKVVELVLGTLCIWSGRQENYQFTRQILGLLVNSVTASTTPPPVVAHQKLVNFTQGCVVDSISLGKLLLDLLYLVLRPLISPPFFPLLAHPQGQNS
ncbi:unnamed protein product [Orchesella dallaii]|uniref:Uncharacterized protein n=1 Tax=Orchesella dallaii TaxID=48710 RepID=A0ABP1QUA1_9HEXA